MFNIKIIYREMDVHMIVYMKHLFSSILSYNLCQRMIYSVLCSTEHIRVYSSPCENLTRHSDPPSRLIVTF